MSTTPITLLLYEISLRHIEGFVLYRSSLPFRRKWFWFHNLRDSFFSTQCHPLSVIKKCLWSKPLNVDSHPSHVGTPDRSSPPRYIWDSIVAIDG